MMKRITVRKEIILKPTQVGKRLSEEQFRRNSANKRTTVYLKHRI